FSLFIKFEATVLGLQRFIRKNNFVFITTPYFAAPQKNTFRCAQYIFLRRILCLYGIEIGAIHIVGFTSFMLYKTLLGSAFLCELRL
ncbi:MAG: hypothetical protein MRZ61_07065, partial [Oscillospiraceae bacterium]|nr:hypothetical protein [Oscillospiraceae bacterium]